MPELTESIESINQQLIDYFGVDTASGQPIWRVVWSEDQFEHRLGTYDDFVPNTDIYLRTVTEVRWVPKYRQWVKERWVLERLVVIPEQNLQELPAVKLSYEPIYPFQTGSGKYLPPSIRAAKFAVELIYAAQGKGSVAKYADPYAGLTKEDYFEKKRQEIDEMQKELFGNESLVGDALAHNEAIIVPRNYEKKVKL
jgi:hypothetical protein